MKLDRVGEDEVIFCFAVRQRCFRGWLDFLFGATLVFRCQASVTTLFKAMYLVGGGLIC